MRAESKVIGENLVIGRFSEFSKLDKRLKVLATPARLERATLCLEGRFRGFSALSTTPRNHCEHYAQHGFPVVERPLADSSKIQRFGSVSGEQLVNFPVSEIAAIAAPSHFSIIHQSANFITSFSDRGAAMAKRFTDTNKWSKEWYRKLGPKFRDVWQYLLDHCSHAGIWEIDLETLKHFTGTRVTIADIKNAFGDRVTILSDNKLFVRTFFEFQYGTSKEGFKAKVSALRELEKYGLVDSSGNLLNSNPECSELSMDCLSISNSKGKSNSKSIVTVLNFDFEAAYALYPKRIKGPKAEERFHEQIKSQQDFDDLLASLRHYVAMLALPENSYRQPKGTFEAFLGTKTSGFFWRDFIAPESCLPSTQKGSIESWADRMLREQPDGQMESA